MSMLEDILGVDPKQFTVWQVSLRAIITYIFMVLVVKIGHKRFMGSTTPFDTVLGFILGSVVSRAINGQAAFFPTLAGSMLLVLLHWSTGWLALRVHWIGRLFKGRSHVLYKDGVLDEHTMRRHLISREDIEQYMRQTANIDRWDDVRSATLERSGQIGIVKKSQE